MKELAAAISSIFLRLRFGWLRMWSGIRRRAGHVHLPVDDAAQRDVAFRVDQRREQRAARIDAQVAERGRPDGHLVLLLLSKLARHVVGEQQRRDTDYQTEHDDEHAVTERKEGICESFFHGRGLFALGVLLREYPAVAGRVGEQLDGGPHLLGRAEPSGVPRRHNSGSA